MVKKRHRLLRSFASLAAGSLVIAACQSGAETVSPEGGRHSFEGTTLRLLLKEGYEIDVIEEFKDEFTDETGINIEVEIYDEPTARQKFVLDSTSQTGTYDIINSSFWNLPEYVSAEWLEPLEPYIEQAQDDWLNLDDIPEGGIEAMTVDDDLFALPHSNLGGMLFYRADVFEELDIEAPEDVEDIMKAAETIKEEKPDLIPFTARGASTFASLGTDLGWAYGYGATLFNDDDSPNADSPEMIDAMEDFVDLMTNYGASDAATLTFTQAGEKFSSGDAAMIFDNSAFGTIFEDPDQSQVAGDVGYATPHGPSGEDLQWLYNEGLAITANSENKDAAWLFLQWRLSRDVTMKELTELHRTDVPNLHVMESDEYADYVAEQDVEDYAAAVEDSLAEATAEHWPFYPEFAEIGDQFSAGISRAITGKVTVEEALQDVQSDLTKTMKSAGYID